MGYIALAIIRIYQKTLSPNHGIFKHYPSIYKCKFSPTCSEYAYDAIEKQGFLKGSLMSLKRISKCRPGNEGGYDPVK